MAEWIITLTVALAGVVAGFALNEVSSRLRHYRQRRNQKAALWDELQSVQHQLNDKVRIADEVMEAVKSGRMMPARSVPFPSVAFSNYFASILQDLTPAERDNIRHIYSLLPALDEITDNLEAEFTKDGSVNAAQALIAQLTDLVAKYRETQDLIADLLAGRARDIYNRLGDPT